MVPARPWYFGPLVGAIAGVVILGGGGRLAMRQIAVLQGAAGSWTFEGTLTVLLSGAASGAAGGVIRAITGIGGRVPPSLRFMLFAAACFFLTIRGLHPVDSRNLLLFMPLVALYVVVVELAWRRLPATSQLIPPRETAVRAG